MITPRQFTMHYPKLYHMAEAGSWPLILTHGLLSTSALLDLFGVHGNARTLIESTHRPESVEIVHDQHGRAVIRDQIPMRESALKGCLKGCSPTEWYEFLNRRVFLWVTERRVQTLLSAKAYRNKEHVVITVDTGRLLDRHESQVMLSPINSGSTIYRPVQRGIDTFRRLAEYPFQERRKLRGSQNAVAELAVDYSIPDIVQFVERVERRRGPRVIGTMFIRK